MYWSLWVWERWFKYLRKAPFGMLGWSSQPEGSGSICYQPSVICLPPASGSSKARAFPRAPLGLVSLLRSGIAPPCVVTLPVLSTGLMSNFCSFLLPQGLPSSRFGNCHPAASHSAAHLLKNRYGGMSQSFIRKWRGGGGSHCILQEPGVLWWILWCLGLSSCFSCVQGSWSTVHWTHTPTPASSAITRLPGTICACCIVDNVSLLNAFKISSRRCDT